MLVKPFILSLVLLLLSLGACSDTAKDMKLPPLPDFDDKTETAVVEAVNEYYDKLKADPGFETLREYGKVLQAHRREELAVEVYQQCLEYKEDFECLYLCGRMLVRKDPKRARAFLERALKLRQDFAPAYLEYCEALEILGEAEAAVAAARKAMDLDPSPLAYYSLGRNLLSANKAKEAVEYLEIADEKTPNQTSVLNLLARAYSMVGDKENAKRTTDRISRLKDEKGTFASNNSIMRSVLLKGRSYQSMQKRVVGALTARRYDKALLWANRRLAIKDDEAANYAFRADAYVGLKRYREAVADFEKAASLAPENALIQVKMSNALVLAGRPQDGFKAVLKARRLNPKDPVARYYFAMHTWQAKPQQAMKSLEMAVRYDPKYADARILMAKMFFVAKLAKRGRHQLALVLKDDPQNRRAQNLLNEYKDLK